MTKDKRLLSGLMNGLDEAPLKGPYKRAIARRFPRFAQIVLISLLAARCDARAPVGHQTVSTARTVGDAGAFPVFETDDLDHKVVVASEPRRIVALLPSHAETLFALGVGDRIVGVDDYSTYPSSVSNLPRLGGLYDVRIEALLALKPDLVLGSPSSPASASLARLGLTVWSTSAKRFDEVFDVIARTGKLVGRGARALELVQQTRQDIAIVQAALRGFARVSVYFELHATPYAVGPESFVGVLLSKAGGDNVVPMGLGEFPKVSPELIAAANPEIILGASLSEIRRRPGWTALRAVQDGRVFSLTAEERDIVVRPGPRLAAGLRVLAHLLHPEVRLQ